MDHLLSAESVIAEEGFFSFFFLFWTGGEGVKPHCYGSQAPSLFYGYFCPSLPTTLSFPIHILLYFSLDRSVLLHTLSIIPSLFASES